MVALILYFFVFVGDIIFEVIYLYNEKTSTYENILSIKNVSFIITNCYDNGGRRLKNIIEDIIVKKAIENND